MRLGTFTARVRWRLATEKQRRFDGKGRERTQQPDVEAMAVLFRVSRLEKSEIE